VTERVQWDQETYLRLVGKAGFTCETLAGNPEYPHHIAYRDDTAVVFLSKFPFLRGHLLVAPITHREQVVSDFTLAEYLALQTCSAWAASRATGTCTGI
jgi:diadenosine tetraphosphate (Ap4A) HIT family hydrolase